MPSLRNWELCHDQPISRQSARQPHHCRVGSDALTPARFVECLSALGWTGRHVAVRMLHCDTNLPTRWSRGDAPVPLLIANWLEACVGGIVPPPIGWRARDQAAARVLTIGRTRA